MRLLASFLGAIGFFALMPAELHENLIVTLIVVILGFLVGWWATSKTSDVFKPD
jgi:cell division protein FtsX